MRQKCYLIIRDVWETITQCQPPLVFAYINHLLIFNLMKITFLNLLRNLTEYTAVSVIKMKLTMFCTERIVCSENHMNHTVL